jgi:hypothetical protein
MRVNAVEGEAVRCLLRAARTGIIAWDGSSPTPLCSRRYARAAMLGRFRRERGRRRHGGLRNTACGYFFASAQA